MRSRFDGLTIVHDGRIIHWHDRPHRRLTVDPSTGAMTLDPDCYGHLSSVDRIATHLAGPDMEDDWRRAICRILVQHHSKGGRWSWDYIEGEKEMSYWECEAERMAKEGGQTWYESIALTITTWQA